MLELSSEKEFVGSQAASRQTVIVGDVKTYPTIFLVIVVLVARSYFHGKKWTASRCIRFGLISCR